MPDSPLLVIAVVAMVVMLFALAVRLLALATREKPKVDVGVRLVGTVAAVVGLAALLLAWITTR